MLGAWFMATDYVTSPITQKGQIMYMVSSVEYLTWTVPSVRWLPQRDVSYCDHHQ